MNTAPPTYNEMEQCWGDGAEVSPAAAEVGGAVFRLRESIPPDEPNPSQNDAGRARRAHKRDMLTVLDALDKIFGALDDEKLLAGVVYAVQFADGVEPPAADVEEADNLIRAFLVAALEAE